MAVLSDAIVVIGQAALVVAVFVTVVLGLGALTRLGPVHPVLTLVAAALVGIVSPVVRRGLRRLANAIVYRQWVSPEEVVPGLAARMGREPEEMLAEAATLVRAATGANRVAVRLHLDDTWSTVASAPSTETAHDENGLVIPIHHADDEVGALVLIGGDPLPPGAQRVVSDVATQAGVVTRTLQLREGLRRGLATAQLRHREVVVARKELVAVQDAERRRLERDIHDTCQQRATLIAGHIGLAGALVGTNPDAARDALARAASDVESLAASVQRLASGNPVADLLGDGLGAALRAQAIGLPFSVTVHDLLDGRCEPEVESVLFLCATEALQNAAQHSGASTVEIGLSQADGDVVLTARDNGSGFDLSRPTAGTGLRNMRERLEPWRGTLVIRPSADGTLLEVRIPLERP